MTAPLQKLLLRGALPGAYGYDLAAHAFSRAKAAGVPVRELLAPALPTSWMVNSRAASPTFQRWLQSPCVEAWAELLSLVDVEPAAWLARDAQTAARVATLFLQLGIDGHGPAAVSKVLALLAPRAVPLMDDAAIHLLTGGVPEPKDADHPSAGPQHAVPMLDAFCRKVVAEEGMLRALAAQYALCPLTPGQVADRLLWFDSWGHRHLVPR